MSRSLVDPKDVSNILVLIGLPVVDEKKVAMLKKVLEKRLKRNDEQDINIISYEIPLTDASPRMTAGHAFVEFATSPDVSRVLNSSRGRIKLDASNTLTLVRLSDFANLVSVPETYTPLTKEELNQTTSPDRFDWMLEGDGRDVFSVRYKDQLVLQYVDPTSLARTAHCFTAEKIPERTPVVTWSPFGSLLAIVGGKGFEVRAGLNPTLTTIVRRDAPDIIDAEFSPKERFLATITANEVAIYDALDGTLLWSTKAIRALSPGASVASVLQFSADERYVAVLRHTRVRGSISDYEPAPLGIVSTETWLYVPWTDAPLAPPGFAFAPLGSLFAYWTAEDAGKAGTVTIVDPDPLDDGDADKAERLRVVESKQMYNLRHMSLHWSGDADTLMCRVVGFHKTSVEASIGGGGPRAIQGARNTTVDVSSLEFLRANTGARSGAARRAVPRAHVIDGLIESLSWQRANVYTSSAAIESGTSSATVAGPGMALFACATSQTHQPVAGENAVTIYEVPIGASATGDVKVVAKLATGPGPRTVDWSPHPLGDHFVLVSRSGSLTSFTFARIVTRKKAKKDKTGAATERVIEVLRKEDLGEVAKFGWSPSGRYFSAAVTLQTTNLQNGVKIWSVLGEPIPKLEYDELRAFAWRPRVPSQLPEKAKLEIERTLTSRIEKWRQARGPVADPQVALARQRRDILQSWVDWRAKRRAALKAAQEERYAERGFASDDEEIIVEELVREL